MILVAGPPCGGKTTYVREHMRPGQKVVDWDDIIEELGGTRYEPTPEVVAGAHYVWRERIPNADWVIWTAPKRAARGSFRQRHNAQVVVVMAPLAVCLERAAKNRPLIWQTSVMQWFTEWEPSSSGRETIVMTHDATA